jgi:hypothetical protein
MFNEEEFLTIANRPTVQFTGDEFKTKDSDKKRIIEYINQNELDYKISDNGIFKFHLISDDGYMFQIYDYNDQFFHIIWFISIKCTNFMQSIKW